MPTNAELAELVKKRGERISELEAEIESLKKLIEEGPAEVDAPGDCIGFLSPVAAFVALGAAFKLCWVGCSPDVALTLQESTTLCGVTGASWIAHPDFGRKEVVLTRRSLHADGGKPSVEERRIPLECFKVFALKMPVHVAALFQLPDEEED